MLNIDCLQFTFIDFPTCSLNSLARNDQNCLCPSVLIREKRGNASTNHNMRNDFLQWRESETGMHAHGEDVGAR